MAIDVERVRADGFLEDEIRQVQEHCEAAEKAGRVKSEAALIWLNGKCNVYCTTVAEVYDRLRPGCWLNRPGGKHYKEAKALLERAWKRVQRQKHRQLRSFSKN